MRFIHTSDLHINSPLNSHLPPAKTRERKDELLLSFRSLTSEAMALGADGIIISGDLFDSERISSKALNTVISTIERADEITFFYLPGNHEKDALAKCERELPSNLKVFGDEWTYFDFMGVQIVGKAKTCKDMFTYLSLDESKPSIVALHGELRDYSDEGGVIGVKDIAKLRCDYMALGHYHSFSEKKINDRLCAVYCGTPEGRGFDETGAKGYVVLDIDKNGASYSFKKRASRTLFSIEVDISKAATQYELERLIEHSVSRASRDDLVRVVLTGEHPADLDRDTALLEGFFADRFYYFEVRDESKLKINVEDYALDKSLKGEFVRLVMADENLSEGEKSSIIECGLRALMGEKIKR